MPRIVVGRLRNIYHDGHDNLAPGRCCYGVEISKDGTYLSTRLDKRFYPRNSWQFSRIILVLLTDIQLYSNFFSKYQKP